MAEADNDTAQAELLGNALRRLRQARGLSQQGAAEKAGMESGQAWGKYERGIAPGIFQPSVQKRLAEAIGSDVFTLLKIRNELADEAGGLRPKSEASKPFTPQDRTQLIVRDRVQAGAWLLADDTGQDARPYPAVRDDRFPYADQWISLVVGDSVDQLRIFDGDHAHFVDAIDIRYQPRTGDIVEVERTRFQRRERELTIKQVEVLPDAVLLWPRSSNPRWREPVRLVDDIASEDVEVRIRGLLLRTFRSF